MKKWVTPTIRIMPRLAQDHRDPHLEVHSQVIKHLFFRTNADPVPHQSHYFRYYLVLLVSLILSNKLQNNNKMVVVVLEIGFVIFVIKIIFLAEPIASVAKLLNKKLHSNKIILIETKEVQTKIVVDVPTQTGIAQSVIK